MATATSPKFEARKKVLKLKHSEQPAPEKKSSKKTKIQPPKAVVKKVKNQPNLENNDEKKIQKKKTRSLETLNQSKKNTLKKSKSSAEIKQRSSSSPAVPLIRATTATKSVSKKPKKADNPTSKSLSTITKKQESTDPKHSIRITDKKKSSKKQKPTLASSPPPPLPAKKPKVRSIGTSTAPIGIDMSTQTEPMMEPQMIPHNMQSTIIDIRDLVPVNALKITLEELMDNMQMNEKQNAIVEPKTKQANIKSKIRQALKSIKL